MKSQVQQIGEEMEMGDRSPRVNRSNPYRQNYENATDVRAGGAPYLGEIIETRPHTAGYGGVVTLGDPEISPDMNQKHELNFLQA